MVRQITQARVFAPFLGRILFWSPPFFPYWVPEYASLRDPAQFPFTPLTLVLDGTKYHSALSSPAFLFLSLAPGCTPVFGPSRPVRYDPKSGNPPFSFFNKSHRGKHGKILSSFFFLPLEWQNSNQLLRRRLLPSPPSVDGSFEFSRDVFFSFPLSGRDDQHKSLEQFFSRDRLISWQSRIKLLYHFFFNLPPSLFP